MGDMNMGTPGEKPGGMRGQMGDIVLIMVCVRTSQNPELRECSEGMA